jgi:predicted CopG family antitoxin
LQIKRKNESFSDLLLRLLENQKPSLEKSFGAWDLSEDEKKEIWDLKWERFNSTQMD